MGLHNISRLFEYFADYPRNSSVAIDLVHDVLISGVILARKPKRVLELGVGSGFLSGMIIKALDVNGEGSLTCVDNLHDWKGAKPLQIQKLEKHERVTVVLKDEYAFLKECPAGRYDLIISDGDHAHSFFFLKELFNAAQKGAILFFHDTNNSMFPHLRRIEKIVKASGLSCYHFKEKSLPEERTDRGLLFVVKDRDITVNIPLKDRMRWKWRMLRGKRRRILAALSGKGKK